MLKSESLKMKSQHIVIMVMCGSRKEASLIVDSLLKKRLVACANVMAGIESCFWWKNRINKADEVLVIMKSVRANFRKIESDVRSLHSYAVPEVIALPITRGGEEYLRWIRDSVRQKRGSAV